MKKLIPFLTGAGLLLAAGVALAYSGGHTFTDVSSVDSNGHTTKSSYEAQGSLPFNGHGNYDRSRISLKGTLTVYEQDGVLVNPPASYCLKIQGKVNTAGQGNVSVTQYQDVRCKKVASQGSYAVSSYTEETDGAFTLEYQDSAGVVTTASGTHTYSN